MEIKLKPFMTPNYVIQEAPARSRQEGFVSAPSFPLSDVDAETLSRMCEEFRSEIFRKAGKTDPQRFEIVDFGWQVECKDDGGFYNIGPRYASLEIANLFLESSIDKKRKKTARVVKYETRKIV